MKEKTTYEGFILPFIISNSSDDENQKEFLETGANIFL